MASLSAVINGGGLGQIGDIIHNVSTALSGREDDIRDLLTRLDNFIGTLDAQHDHIVAAMAQLNRVAATFAGQRERHRPRRCQDPAGSRCADQSAPQIVTALDRLRDLQRHRHRAGQRHPGRPGGNLKNLEPTLQRPGRHRTRHR